MAEKFDPYYKWLGIPPEEQPPHYYRLLGVKPFEDDQDVMESAANRQMSHVRSYLTGAHAERAQELLNEIARAWASLLDAKMKSAYDAQLRKKLTGTQSVQSAMATRRAAWPDGKVPQSAADFQQCLAALGLLSPEELTAFLEKLPPNARPADAKGLAGELVKAGKLSRFQAAGLVQGKLKFLEFGEYLILDKIGQGGMGQVLKAEHRRMKRVVALKVISSTSMKDSGSIRRFQREVQAAARLIHPNIVTAFDASESDGVNFLVMEFVDGKDLATIVKEKGPLPVDKALDCVLQAARGLAFAHENGIVHRDIKPANLLVDKRGTVKILDMGLARLDTSDPASGELTNSGQVMGTVDYMAPEQALDTKHADARADVYSLGCTLYRVLTNELMYHADTLVGKLLAHREAPIPNLRAKRSDVSPEIEAFFRKLVAKKPDDRYQSMHEVVEAIEVVRGGSAAGKSGIGLGGRSPGASGIGQGSEIGPSDSQLGSFLAGLSAARKSGSGIGTGSSKDNLPLSAVGSGGSSSEHEETLDSIHPEVGTNERLKSLASPSRSGKSLLAPQPIKKGSKLWLFGGLGLGLVVLVGVVAAASMFLGGGGEEPVVKKKPVAKPPVKTPVTPIVDLALDFDGLKSYVEIPGWKYDGTHSLTVEAWVLCRTPGGDRAIISNAEGSGLELSFLATGNDLCFNVHSNGTYIKARADGPLPILTWTHVAGVIEGEQVRLYVNGVRQKQVAQLLAPQTVSSRMLLIGANPDLNDKPTKFFDGLIDEVRISKIVRYEGNFRPRRRLTADAVTEILLHFDEGTGEVAKDASTQKRDAKIVSCNWAKTDLSPFTPGGTPGKPVNPPVTPDGFVYLDDMLEKAWKGKGVLSKHGERGPKQAPLIWNGKQLTHALATMPNDKDGSGTATYTLGGKYELLQATVGLSVQDAVSPVIFRVQGDGRLLWESPPQQKKDVGADLSVSVSGVQELVLTVHDDALKGGASLPVWIEPKLKVVAPAPLPALPPLPLSASAILTFGEHQYQLINTPLSWSEAKAKAESLGGHLAAINTQEERDWVLKEIYPLATHDGKERRFYLGGSQPQAGAPWEWVTGEPFELPLWLGQGPNDSDKAAHLLTWQNETAWDDVGANFKPLPYLIEWDSLTPPPVVTPPAPAPLPAGVPVNVLAGLSLDRDKIAGEWTLLQGGELVTPSISPNENRSRLYLNLPGPVPDEYDLALSVGRRESAQTPDAGLTVGILSAGKHSPVYLYGANDALEIGLGYIDGKNPAQNGTRKRICDWPSEKRMEVLIQVRRTKPAGVAVRVTVDGAEALRWLGQPEQLTNPHWGVPDQSKLFLGSSMAMHVDQITLTPVAPTSPPPTTPNPQPTDPAPSPQP